MLFFLPPFSLLIPLSFAVQVDGFPISLESAVQSSKKLLTVRAGEFLDLKTDKPLLLKKIIKDT